MYFLMVDIDRVLNIDSKWHSLEGIDIVIVKKGIKCNDFVTGVFDRLGIDPLGKI